MFWSKSYFVALHWRIPVKVVCRIYCTIALKILTELQTLSDLTRTAWLWRLLYHNTMNAMTTAMVAVLTIGSAIGCCVRWHRADNLLLAFRCHMFMSRPNCATLTNLHIERLFCPHFAPSSLPIFIKFVLFSLPTIGNTTFWFRAVRSSWYTKNKSDRVTTKVTNIFVIMWSAYNKIYIYVWIRFKTAVIFYGHLFRTNPMTKPCP